MHTLSPHISYLTQENYMQLEARLTPSSLSRPRNCDTIRITQPRQYQHHLPTSNSAFKNNAGELTTTDLALNQMKGQIEHAEVHCNASNSSSSTSHFALSQGRLKTTRKYVHIFRWKRMDQT